MTYHVNQQVFDAILSEHVQYPMKDNSLPLSKHHLKVPVNYLPPATEAQVILLIINYSLLHRSAHW